MQGTAVRATRAFPDDLKGVLVYPREVQERRTQLECFRYGCLDKVKTELVNGYCASSSAFTLTDANRYVMKRMMGLEQNRYLIRTLLKEIYFHNMRAYSINLHLTAADLRQKAPLNENQWDQKQRRCFIRALEGKAKANLEQLTKMVADYINSLQEKYSSHMDERRRRELGWLQQYKRDYYFHMIASLNSEEGHLPPFRLLCVRFPESTVQQWRDYGMDWMAKEWDDRQWGLYLAKFYLGCRDHLFASNAPYHNILHRDCFTGLTDVARFTILRTVTFAKLIYKIYIRPAYLAWKVGNGFLTWKTIVDFDHTLQGVDQMLERSKEPMASLGRDLCILSQFTKFPGLHMILVEERDMGVVRATRLPSEPWGSRWRGDESEDEERKPGQDEAQESSSTSTSNRDDLKGWQEFWAVVNDVASREVRVNHQA